MCDDGGISVVCGEIRRRLERRTVLVSSPSLELVVVVDEALLRISILVFVDGCDGCDGCE